MRSAQITTSPVRVHDPNVYFCSMEGNSFIVLSVESWKSLVDTSGDVAIQHI